MSEYSEAYLKQYFDNFKFFNHECRHKMLREQMMRTRACLRCPGFEACKLHPHFWLEGETEREKANEKLRKIGISRT